MADQQSVGAIQVGAMDMQAVNDALGQVRDRFVDVARVAPWSVKNIAGNYTATYGDGLIFADAAAGAFTVTLPSARLHQGHELSIKRLNATNAVTIKPASGETIDGGSAQSLSTQYECLTLVSNGSSWLII